MLYSTCGLRGNKADLFDRIDRMLGQGSLLANAAPAQGVAREWSPAVDVREEEGRFVLYLDLPGVDPKDIDVSADAGVLSVRGERVKQEGQDNGYRRSERVSGRFERRFSLPEGTNTDGIEARGRHGVLEVIVPKQPALQPKRIDVTH
jgi:HSP20 family protein